MGVATFYICLRLVLSVIIGLYISAIFSDD